MKNKIRSGVWRVTRLKANPLMLALAACIASKAASSHADPQSKQAGQEAVPVYASVFVPVPDAESQRDFLRNSRSEHNKTVAWKPVASMTFEDPQSLKDLRIVQGLWEVGDGKLRAVGGRKDSNRTILLTSSPAGAVRIEFDATLFPRSDGRIGDICIRLNADPITGSFARGHALITAQYWNQASVCYKLNIPIARTEWSPVVPGQSHRVVVEWTPSHLRFFLDGRIVLDAWDRDSPLSPDPTKWIGISTYDTLMEVDNISISTS